MTIKESGEQVKRWLRTQIYEKYAGNYRFQYNEKKRTDLDITLALHLCGGQNTNLHT